MRIGWISECSERALHAGSKAAHVSNVILPLLARRAEVQLYTSVEDVSANVKGCCQVLPISALTARERSRPSDVLLAQLEDRRENSAVREALAIAGGILWLHDWYERQAPNDSELTIPEVARERSPVLFSSMRNMTEFRKSFRDSVSYYVPYPVNVPAAAVPPRLPAIALCASAWAEDQVHVVLAALASVAEMAAVHWALPPGNREEAERIRREFPVLNIQLYESLSAETWGQILRQSAGALHLHHSAYGDPGPLFALSLISGCPVIASDFGEPVELRDARASKSAPFFFIAPGDMARAQLDELFWKLFRDPENADPRDVARAGRELALELFDARIVTAELMNLFESVISGRDRSLRAA